MNINQALKEKNRLAGKVKVLAARLQSCNKRVEGTDPPYIFDSVLKEYLQAKDELVSLKVKISIASQPVFNTILSMGEIKSIAQTLKSISVVDDDYRGFGSASTKEYVFQIKERERDELVEQYEKQISIMQDKIDQFNATTEI